MFDVRYALPPIGATVRDTERNRYGMVTYRSGRQCQVRYLDGTQRSVFVSNLEVVRKVRTVY